MKVTTRDIIILAIFTVSIGIGCVLYYKHLNPPVSPIVATTPRSAVGNSSSGAKASGTPRTSRQPVAASAVPEMAFVSTLAPGTIPPQYSVIVERNLFAPLIAAAKPSTGGGGKPGPPGHLEIGPVPPITIGPSGPFITRQVPPTPAGPPPSTGGRTSYPPVALPPLALTGFIVAGGVTKVSIENLQFATSRVVGVGDSIWGWRVVRVDRAQHRVVVRPDTAALAKAVELRLGEGKTENGLSSGYEGGGGDDENGPPGMKSDEPKAPPPGGGRSFGGSFGAPGGMPVPGGYSGRRFRGGGGGGYDSK